ncbi:hypothetical protein BKA64DRAFT_712132 [Cadophora sp. MPI-SDFR-AT-0126]|nr:hypothetical protein BKA64DRAFT_712132 [Leotiomycetes sp. MPI-SDFR-AT-0126]
MNLPPPFGEPDGNGTDFEWEFQQSTDLSSTDLESLSRPSSDSWNRPLPPSTNFDFCGSAHLQPMSDLRTTTVQPVVTHDTLEGNSWARSHSYQQQVEMLDFNPNHEQQFTKRLLHDEGARQYEKRRRILARNKTSTIFSQQQQQGSVGQLINTDPSSYQQVDMMDFGFDHQSNMHNFTANTGLTPVTFLSCQDAFAPGLPLITSSHHDNAMDGMFQAENVQQDIHQPGFFSLTSSTVTSSGLEAPAQTTVADEFRFLWDINTPPPTATYSDDASLPGGVNMLQASPSLGLEGNVTGSQPNMELSIAPNDLDRPNYHPPSTIQPILTPLPMIEQQDIPDLDHSNSPAHSIPYGPRTTNGVAKVKSQRGSRSRGLNQHPSRPNGPTDREVETSNGLVIHIYENPETERRNKKARRRTRVVEHGRSLWACFGCFLRGKKCNSAEASPCSGCRELMRRLPSNVPVARSICTDHKELAGIIELYPQLIGQTKLEHTAVSWESAFLALNAIREILDFIEPQHVRQIWRCDEKRFTPTTMSLFLSYGFSVVRWRKAIILVQSALEYDLDIVENFHRYILKWCLSSIADKRLYTHQMRFMTANLLNILYEGLYSLKSRCDVDGFTLNRSLHTLEARISHLYCILLPKDAGKIQQEELDKLVRYLHHLHLTSALVPPEYQHTGPLIWNFPVAWESAVRVLKPWDISSPNLQHLSRSSTTSFPRLSKWLPAPFLSIFGAEAGMWNASAPDDDDPLLFAMNECEQLLNGMDQQDLLSICEYWAPDAFSMVTKETFDALEASTVTGVCSRALMAFIITKSITLCLQFLSTILEIKEELLDVEYLWEKMLGLFYTWPEKSGYLQEAGNEFARLLEQSTFSARE